MMTHNFTDSVYYASSRSDILMFLHNFSLYFSKAGKSCKV